MKYYSIAFSIFYCILSNYTLSAQYKVEKLGMNINSDLYDEISPVLSRDGTTMYFTRVASPDFCRTLIQDEIDISATYTEAEYFNELKSIYTQIAGKYVDDPFTSTINQEIIIAESGSSPFDKVYQPGYPLNNALPNSVCALAPFDQGLVVINHFFKDGGMHNGFSFSHKAEDGNYTFPEPFFIRDFSSLSPEVNLSMSIDGDVVILSLKREKGYGESDLYVCFKLKDNLWSEPVNMGPVINSAYRESTPYLSEDKTRLFFASNKPGGKGGTDIYMTRRLDYTWTRWTKPALLLEPINSKFDDSHPSFVESTGNLYFTSRRDGTSDIFKVNMEVVEKISRPITLRGVIKNAITKAPLEHALLYYNTTGNSNQENTVTKEDGRFEITVDIKETYRLSPRKNGFIGKNQLVDLNILSQSKITSYEIEFLLMPLGEDQKIEIKNINFEISTSNLLASSLPDLDYLADLLTKNETIKIRIEGHTDAGNEIDYQLMELSRQRAQAVKKYLVLKKNIGSHRINTVGYGRYRPLFPNDSEANRSKNRRVEIYVESADLSSKINYADLPDPIVRYSSDDPEINSVEALSSSNLSSSKSNSVLPATNASPKLTVYGKINFQPGTLAIQESSFAIIRNLAEYMMTYTDKKIALVGQSYSKDEAKNTEAYALLRAQGVKEYLIFKSIKPDRIIIMESVANTTFSGVQVLVSE